MDRSELRRGRSEAKKRGWKNIKEKQRKEEDPIERYCYGIRGERAAYVITYEMRESMAANVEAMIAKRC